MFVGVMLLFWGVLLGVELRDVRAWSPAQSTLPGAAAAALASGDAALSLELGSDAPELTSDAPEYSSTSLVRESTALRTFGWAQLAAGAGVAMSVLNLLSRRSRWGLAFTALALVCILTSSRLFSIARTQLPERALAAP